jgi:NADP-dependent 3-hydroxy acid dehydrogenase YdfG
MSQKHKDFAVVTGAGSGIGRAVAIDLSKEPLTILAVGRRLDALEATAAEAPGAVLALSADVATEEGRAAILTRLGTNARVKYLVHGAGILPIERLSEITLETWRAVMTTNVEARLFLTRALVPHLRGGGRVLFIGSMSATRARKGSTAYCTALAASFMLQQDRGHECRSGTGQDGDDREQSGGRSRCISRQRRVRSTS